MRIVSDEWLNVTENYCEHYDVDETHYGELKRLKKDAPEEIKKIYAQTIREWKKKGYELPEDAEEYL